MPSRKDLTGQRHGNLVVLGQSDHKYLVPATGQTMLLWRVQCRLCGCIKDMTGSSFRRNVSCGCARPVKETRSCPICGKNFSASPSSRQICCGKECSLEWKRRNGTAGGKKWSLEAKVKRRNDAAVKARMTNMQKAGMDAALKIPAGQRGPQNREALLWILIDPAGQYHKAVNLVDWARKNKGLFFGPGISEDMAAQRISKGFGAIAASMRNVQSRKGKPVTSYKGWRLAELPRVPTESDKEYDNTITVNL